MAGKPGMHKRLSTSPAYADAVRARIQVAKLIDRLENHALGEIEMSPTQVQAATILLRKVVPDKTEATTEVNTSGTLPVVIERAGQ